MRKTRCPIPSFTCDYNNTQGMKKDVTGFNRALVHVSVRDETWSVFKYTLRVA